MSDEEFGGIGFAAGVVRGTRSFDVDKLGRLTGVTFQQVWVPGENNAVCRKEERDFDYIYRLAGFGYTPPPSSFRYTVAAPASPAKSWVDKFIPPSSTAAQSMMFAAKKVEAERERAEKEAAERAARDSLVDCAHGFYGYYDGSNDYYKAGRVMGVVEGYGETVIGTRGFRSMKARIVAIRIPKHVPARLRNMIIRNYPSIPVFDSFKAMVAEFPPDDAGSGISPETDADFWTRSV